MSTSITTADVLPFTWGGYTYTAKQELSIECKPSPILSSWTNATCEILKWASVWVTACENDRYGEIQKLRCTIHNRCQHYLLADDSALTPEGLSKKHQLHELFTVTKQ